MQCSEECKDLHIGEIKQPINKQMAENSRGYRPTLSSLTMPLGEGHSFKDIKVHILDSEGRWLARGIEKAIYIKMEQLSMNGMGTIDVHLSFYI